MSSFRRFILVTGSTDGIGQQTALELAKNAENFVIIHGRSAERIKKTCEMIQKQTGSDGNNLGTILADFGRLKDVTNMAEELKTKFDKLNVVICNAGVLSPKRQISEDGIELALQVNHLAHFLLCNKIADLLKQNAPSRVAVVSSICHDWFPMAWDDMEAEKDYEKYTQYSRAKLMNLMFAYAFGRHMEGTGVYVNGLEPGVIQTKLLKAGGFSGSPVEQGARASVHLAQSAEVEGVAGKYYDNSGRLTQSCAESRDVDLQEKLWKISEEYCMKVGVW